MRGRALARADACEGGREPRADIVTQAVPTERVATQTFSGGSRSKGQQTSARAHPAARRCSGRRVGENERRVERYNSATARTINALGGAARVVKEQGEGGITGAFSAGCDEERERKVGSECRLG